MNTSPRSSNAPVPDLSRLEAIVDRFAQGVYSKLNRAELVAECDRLSKLLAEAWSALETISRQADSYRAMKVAGDLLRKQGAPGWKGGAS